MLWSCRAYPARFGDALAALLVRDGCGNNVATPTLPDKTGPALFLHLVLQEGQDTWADVRALECAARACL